MDQTETKVHGTRGSQQFASKTDLEKALATAVSNIQSSIEENFHTVNETLTRLEAGVSANRESLVQQKHEIDSLRKENEQLRLKHEDMEARLTTLETNPETSANILEEINNVKERVEERTNRQLRQTLVIKGVPENDGETWEQTKQLLASTISNNVNTSYNNAYSLLNRVHRSRSTNNPRKRGRRDIFANIFRWDMCEKLVQDFRNLNIRGKTNIQIEYKYGPLTSNRRIQAMECRKFMKDAGEITSGYVAYPARLMAKRRGSTEYAMIKNFSKSSYKEYKRPSDITSGPPPLANSWSTLSAVEDIAFVAPIQQPIE